MLVREHCGQNARCELGCLGKDERRYGGVDHERSPSRTRTQAGFVLLIVSSTPVNPHIYVFLSENCIRASNTCLAKDQHIGSRIKFRMANSTHRHLTLGRQREPPISYQISTRMSGRTVTSPEPFRPFRWYTGLFLLILCVWWYGTWIQMIGLMFFVLFVRGFTSDSSQLPPQKKGWPVLSHGARLVFF